MERLRIALGGQLDVAWSLLTYHLRSLDDDECLWRPSPFGLHVREEGDRWRADWPDTEDYSLGPPSIAWTTWHIGFWWSMVLDHSFHDGQLGRGDVAWPGSVEATRSWLVGLHEKWVDALASLDDDDFTSSERTRWPFSEGPFHRVVAWLNLELTKNAAEIGYGRFLYAVRGRSQVTPVSRS